MIFRPKIRVLLRSASREIMATSLLSPSAFVQSAAMSCLSLTPIFRIRQNYSSRGMTCC